MKLKFLFRAICPSYTYVKDVRAWPLIIINYDHKSTKTFRLDEIIFSGANASSEVASNISWRDYRLKKL